MAAFKHIVVPTDFGEIAEQALDLAVDLAKTYGAKLTLVHVYSIPTPAYAEAFSWPIEEIGKAAREALDRELASAKARHPDTEAVLDLGVAHERIVELVKSRGADLVVMGTHGRRGLPRFLLGSVAEKVVRLSPVPVLTVPGPQPHP
jgi:nucleotide-binding universal stress UspA family protein